MNFANHLLVFARLPKVGINKTRLISAIGAENATLVYRQLVDRTLCQVRQLVSEQGVRVTVCYTGGSASDIENALGDDLEFHEQIGQSLGDRLQLATKTAFEAGANRVIVIGTDCPSLTSQDLSSAFQQLEAHDMVIGPALDGGYYLIGLNAECGSLFTDIDWSTSKVLEQTVHKSRELNLRVHQLRILADVDYPEDLLPLRASGEGQLLPFHSESEKLSVIIPTINEEQNLPATLRSIGPIVDDLEVIVVDAGSTDQTRSIAEQSGCKVFVGNRGRAKQMNAGAAVATGEHLLFLHADTLLPEGYRCEIRRVLDDSVVCGAFPLTIDTRRFTYRLLECCIAFRSRVLQMPYGDQAIFFRAADFYQQGGFRTLKIMEDYELVARTRKLGRIGFATHPVTTSGRRWLKKGILKTTIINQMCILAYRLGFSDEQIAKFYSSNRANTVQSNLTSRNK
ncbi:MAG TPA: TIGR04283 family arsenosugar biosynthesis glycosyltransferase [Pirellulaceae bacterium]|nr:TIGR04283 family arsenosugar biosynthesis glycosyltransferase [Pirellulaceae bacterium]HMO94068.1 TIGR04283 family arsenosugar biosynthesis glycosyltransferase [Pirellulaceae bacterium]HMP70924.1 TIGR04283 family arsenosugar biosynthesis glycosyltransferase [Pirellulaceae bacterium]